MTISLVNEAGGYASPPTLSFPRRSASGDYLLALIAQQSPAIPTLSGDSLGSTWYPVSSSSAPVTANDPTGLSIALFHAYVPKNGPDTITFGTTTQSAYGAMELAGVLQTPLGVRHCPVPEQGSTCAVDSTDTMTVGVQAQNPGDFLLAVIACFGQVSFTQTQSGWGTPVSISSPALSMQYVTMLPAAGGSYVAAWTVSAPAPLVCMSVSVPHA
jgi:hypothetical protein